MGGAAIADDASLAMRYGDADRQGQLFDAAKRHGFITPDDGAPDIFLHLSDIAEPARAAIQFGMRLQYSLERKGDKISARDASAAPVEDVARSVPGSGACVEPDFNDDFEKEWGFDLSGSRGSQISVGDTLIANDASVLAFASLRKLHHPAGHDPDPAYERLQILPVGVSNIGWHRGGLCDPQAAVFNQWPIRISTIP